VAVGYIGNEDCTRIRVWDAATAQVSTERPEAPPLWEAEGHGDTVLSLGVHKEAGLVSSGFDRCVRLWEPTSSSHPAAAAEPGGSGPPQSAALVIESGENVPMAAAAWPDGRGLAYGCDDGSLHVWDLVRRKEAMLHPDRHKDGVRTLDVSADGRMVVSAGADRVIRLLCVDEAAPAP
jgi:WD40 repeat protein